MIYITGDCHGNFERFNTDIFPEQLEMNKEDYVIICGDFGGIWDKSGDSKKEAMILNQLECKSYTTLFVDGNHENFERLYNYPVEEWHGGKVHQIRESVIHLMRGEIFNIDNKKFFTFGGARSHDIMDGILNIDEYEKIIYEYRKRGAYFRIRDYSWWDLELPTDEEMKSGIKNLEKVNYKVDYIISHCCPTSIQTLLNLFYKKDTLTDYLQKISEKCEFKKWYFGHYHDYRQVNSQFTLLYENIVPLEFNSIFE